MCTIGNGRDYKHLTKGDIPVFGTGGYMTSVNDYLYDGETTFIGRKGTINKPFYYKGKFWTVDTLFYTHLFNGVTPRFVYCIFQTINWLRYNEASGVPSLSKDAIEKIKVHIPHIEEQQKISKLLFALDERIAVQRALIGEMGRLMGGIREWLFAHTDGKCVRLADVCKIVKGQQVNKQELNESGPYYVMNGGTTPSGYYSKSNTGTGVISISEGGNSCGYVQWNENPFWSGGHCYTIVDISKDAVPHFLYQYLKHKESDIMKLRIGSGLPNIQKKTLECFTVKLPSFTEQTKISTALKAVDLRAKNAEELLRLLLKQKSFFLQKLFI